MRVWRTIGQVVRRTTIGWYVKSGGVRPGPLATVSACRTPSFPGSNLAEHYYTEILAPILDEALDGVPYSAALIGYGSEVQGFDTPRSTDHAWGPRSQVFLSGADLEAHGAELDALLERRLPKEYRGYPVRFAFPHGTLDRHWVDALDARGFFAEKLDADPTGGLSAGQWLTVPTQVLRELTGGAVFHDGLGQFDDGRGTFHDRRGLLTRYRAELAWYPDDVWRYVLACQWTRLSQEEAFVGRCGEVGDDLGSAVVAARQVRDLMKLCMLMCRVYPPYSKWLGSAFAALPCAASLTPSLTAAVRAGTWREREEHLCAAYEAVAALHNGLGLTEPLDGSSRLYFGRPFRALHAERFANALLASVRDPEIRALPPVGAVDQYVDSTDLLYHTHPGRRRRYLAGNGIAGVAR